MVIKLADTAGFCMGVRRAVDIVLERARRKGTERIFTYGPLIHNPQTVEVLQKRGIVPLDVIDDIDGGVVIIRAHGITPDERRRLKAKGATLVDATCPKVARVQSIIMKHTAQGYGIVIIGDADHPEVKSLLGYARGTGMVVSAKDNVSLIPQEGKLCVVAQTTQSSQQFEEIVDAILKVHPDALIFNSICDSTERRQAEVRELAESMDAMVIVGGRDSANTRRLASISREIGIPTFHVETADELESHNMSRFEKIGVSAGASTPNWIIDGVVDYLTHCRGEGDGKRARILFRAWIALVRTDLYSAIGAGCLSLVGMLLQGMAVNSIYIVIAATYVYAVHTINRLHDRNIGRISGSFREESYLKNRSLYWSAAVVCLILSLVLAALRGPIPLVFLLVLSVFGILYDIAILPHSWKVKRLGDIPGSKNLFMALAWAVVAAVVPWAAERGENAAAAVVAFIFVFALVFVKSALSDMIDIQSDRIVGRDTIPLAIGEEKTRRLLYAISVAVAFILLAAPFLGYVPKASLVLETTIFYMWICIVLCDRKGRLSTVVHEGLLGTNYIIAGILGFAWLVAKA